MPSSKCWSPTDKLHIIIYNRLNYRMWFKNGLKAQKLLAQGIALGNYGHKLVAL
ncbi:MAG: hypothetical protein PUB50_02485 [Prevotella copri]|uniref:hypothetical protein n=1 Tax=Segatella copri TaxID=165179 RepID=UPI0025E58F3E|nr:hypothetical protein [Segatella copri]MDD7002072.1 hypothetical protein [Segatella copri]MDY6204071.1 hypothetical protein [Segatella copri]MED9956411.1 hypothetical protein [Segatella copri]